MDRLTKYSDDTVHENGVCCTHFGSLECYKYAGNCSLGCEWEEKAWSKLAHYEDLEEAGRLMVLPCKVGDTVYQILQKGSGHWEEDKYILDDRGTPKIYERGFHLILLNDIGKTVFLTREEAEAALKGGDRE